MLTDHRLGNVPRHYLYQPKDFLMRLPDEMRECVAFVCCKETNGGEPRPKGTAFFAGWADARSGKGFSYLVTAKHCIEQVIERSADGIVHLRLNVKDSGRSWFRPRQPIGFFTLPTEPLM